MSEQEQKTLSPEQELMEFWRFGWDLGTDAESLREWGNAMHRSWIAAIERGDTPNEDVSPGESLWRLADIVTDWNKLKKKEQEQAS